MDGGWEWDTGLGLAVVGGGGDDVDWDVVAGDEAGEVEELVEMALCRKRDHHHRDVGLLVKFNGCHESEQEFFSFKWCVSGPKSIEQGYNINNSYVDYNDDSH
ncbi:hypothetical protein HanXRQr2_Chr08g0329831 [Helianthus annuus]|uniref:Uncharacterized protein n=1 Tax=Helianthus annuus TaxID=4232 RepID=A0A9K3IDE4_HELAN|nr:hypothetical protein HanXRQr2_Chr08g0329831 [Helianthus annuus]KAJ0900896.1 hypothetical protein HanPSC8_Chr08g0318961 [Helianthus annuus]